MTAINKENICSGVDFISVHDDRFKTSVLTAAILLPMDKENAAANSLMIQMLRHSCKKYPDVTLLNERLCDLYGASLSAHSMKLADCQMLYMSISFINDCFALGDESISKACAELLCSVLFDPDMTDDSFDEHCFEMEKRCLIEDIKSELTDKRYYAVSRCEYEMMKDEPAGIDSRMLLEKAQGLTIEQAGKAWRDMLKSAKITFFMLGATNSDEAKQRISDELKKYDRSFDSLPETIVGKAKEQVHEVAEKMTVTQTKLVMAFRTPIAEPQNTAAMYLASALFGGTPSSLLFKNVREKLSLCYYCSSRYNRQKGTVMVDSGLEHQNIDKAKEEILRQLDCIKNGDFTDDELEETRMAVMSMMDMVGDSLGSIQSWYINQLVNSEMKTPEQMKQDIAAVTKQQVIEAANTLTLDTIYMLTGEDEE